MDDFAPVVTDNFYGSTKLLEELKCFSIKLRVVSQFVKLLFVQQYVFNSLYCGLKKRRILVKNRKKPATKSLQKVNKLPKKPNSSLFNDVTFTVIEDNKVFTGAT